MPSTPSEGYHCPNCKGPYRLVRAEAGPESLNRLLEWLLLQWSPGRL
jgi:hypothetical protein